MIIRRRRERERGRERERERDSSLTYTTNGVAPLVCHGDQVHHKHRAACHI